MEASLDAHHTFLLTMRDLYTANVQWRAPGRGVTHVGREEVVRCLLREASAMQDAEYTVLRRNAGDRQIIDEYAVRFVYAGAGIESAPVAAGDFVELKRVRILELVGGKVAVETCIENWTVLLPAAHPAAGRTG
jgi:predicted amidohydrolase